MDYFHSRRYLDTLPDWEVSPVDMGPLDNYLPRMRALLARLGDPQIRFRSVIVGGTNGKGTTASLLADLLRSAGYSVGLYTSPHLHSLRERIRVDGQLPSKDAWAQATLFLHDRTRDFAEQGVGGFSKYEALTAMAAHLFADAEVDFGLFEVGLGGRYDATNAWDSELAVITSIALDHCEVLGDSLLQIATEKVDIARPGQPLITSVAQEPEVLHFMREQAVERGIRLYLAGAEVVEPMEAGSGGEEAIGYPAEVPSGTHPRSYADNARLALAAACLLAGGGLTPTAAAAALDQHFWPGRFERVQDLPLLILDGAHNPAAAADLVAKLGELAPRWRFVVGFTSGHDASGILQALEPVAAAITLTSSAHPKAVDPEALAASAPQGIPLEIEPFCREALRQARAGQRPGEGLCVLGSLHLVARAREFLELPREREGINEEVALESLECVELACARRGLACARVSGNGNVLRVGGGGAPHYFIRNKHPFNDYAAARLAEDKGYQYELFSQAGLPVPQTLQVFNPLADARFDRYKSHRSVDEIVAQVERELAFPLVVKKYRSSVSQGVYLERNVRDLKRRLGDLFAHSAFADNVVLIQSYVEGPEYRIVGSRGRLLLAYRKQSDEVLVRGDLNPLHHDSGRAEKVEDAGLLQEMETLLAAVNEVVPLGLMAMDLIRGVAGFHILEINPNPFCYFYNRDNGREDFVEIYEQLLAEFVES